MPHIGVRNGKKGKKKAQYIYPHAFRRKSGDIVIPPAICNVIPLLLDHLSWNLKTFTGDSPMDKLEKHSQNFDVTPGGRAREWGGGEGGWPQR